MTDDRLSRWLEAAEQPLAPDTGFAAELRDELRLELGFIAAPAVQPARRYGRRLGSRATPGRSHLLLAATLLLAGAVGLTAVAGGMLEQPIERQGDLLSLIHEAGRVRIAISPDHPQFSAPGQPAAGFDADVARALAQQLGVRGDLVLRDAAGILDGDDDTWDVALPSVPAWEIDPSRFLMSSSYYHWPHRLVVAETSDAAGAGDLAGAPICAVAGDPGEAWLRGQYGATTSAPITTQVVTRSSDADCLAALAAGDVAAIVTAQLSDADINVRAGIKAIGGPDPEPRPVIVRQAQGDAPDPAELMRAIDNGLDALRRDGTLTRLSQNRFGGADLTAP